MLFLASPLSPPPLQLSTSGLRRKNRLKGTICGQCEVKTAGLMCAECTENYCIGCFAKFHQKGALKLHSMIPIQVSIVACASSLSHLCVCLSVYDNKGFPSPLLIGEYNEEESASSFQEALRQWRGEKTMATQADLPPDREAEGQRKEGREERLPVKVEFKENSLTHLDRLRLKKHRRYRLHFFCFISYFLF
uniref:B box-type domain-containing protein n=1 Tax=Stegastes partitus TaxID=144197 RepID=A0A3B4ZN67_9TELE